LVLAAAWTAPLHVHASSSSPAAASPMAGNGHNVTFDGRVFIVSQGPLDPTGGWFMMVFRPERVRYAAGGLLDLMQGAFTPPVQVQPSQSVENALAICEADANNTPYACDDAGNPGGAYACYDLFVIDSDALSNPKDLRRRTLKLWLQGPGTPDASYYKHAWLGGMEPVLNLANAQLRGIEPTVTRDGKLLVWQGHPANDGQIDILMYATNTAPCANVGWDGPHNLSHMHVDPKVVGVYALGERQLRAADGAPFADGQLVHGAYPWLFPDGDALSFTATPMPCKGPENPPGCGPRRNTLSVIGYPTNWGVAPIDGGLNPSTTDQVRLFFSSPGRDTFPQLPLTGGKDVWPLFGSNTANQADVVFDDGLDGNYAGVWHMNESVNAAGELDKARTPDSSGYYNTGQVFGAPFPDANNGIFGKALQLDGTSTWVEVPHTDSLAPVNALSVELWIRPDAPVDCDGNNNYRLLLGKGNLPGPFSLVLEDSLQVHAFVRAGGVERSLVSDVAVPLGAWTHVGLGYDGATGQTRLWLDGRVAAGHDGPPAPLDASAAPLTIGGPGGARAACPNQDGIFQGAVDEVRLSRVLRDLSLAPRPGNGARFVDQSVPAQVEAGAAFAATIRFRNHGTTAWAPAMQHRMGSQAPQDNATWGVGRVELPGRVEPGEVAEVLAELVAPAAVGVYPMQWKLVHDGVEWFGEPSAELQVEVVPAGSLTTAGDETGTGDPATGDDPGPGPGDDGPAPTDDGGLPTSTGAADADPSAGTGAPQPTAPGDDPTADGGCACRPADPRPPATLALLALLGLRRRRRP
jgi:MYXO-CTERM domain-containing protein